MTQPEIRLIMLMLKKNTLAITTLIIASSGIAMSWNSLLSTESAKIASVAKPTAHQQPTIATKKIITTQTITKSTPELISVPAPLLKELMAAIIEQGLADGTYTVENLPLELRPFVRLNRNSSKAVYEAAEEITEQEEERIAAIEAMFDDDYVPPEPEFVCPDPEDPGPQWQGSHGKMILEEKGCVIY